VGALVKRFYNFDGVQGSRYKKVVEIQFYSKLGTGLKFLKRKQGYLEEFGIF
jgi:hypothetical protein